MVGDVEKMEELSQSYSRVHLERLRALPTGHNGNWTILIVEE